MLMCTQELKINELTTLQTQILEDNFIQEQKKDPQLRQLIDYFENGVLPDNDKDSKNTVLQALNFAVIDRVLYFVVVRSQKGGSCCTKAPAEPDPSRISPWKDGRALFQ